MSNHWDREAEAAELKQQQKEQEIADDKAAQRARELGGIAELKKAIALFDENYGKGMEAHARADASSAAVTSGLGGTTRPGAVSAGLSAEFEDMRRGRLAQARTNLGQFLGSYRDPYGVTPNIVSQGVGQQLQFELGANQMRSNFGVRSGGGEVGNDWYKWSSDNPKTKLQGDSVWGPRQLPTTMTGGGGGYGAGS